MTVATTVTHKFTALAHTGEESFTKSPVPKVNYRLTLIIKVSIACQLSILSDKYRFISTGVKFNCHGNLNPI